MYIHVKVAIACMTVSAQITHNYSDNDNVLASMCCKSSVILLLIKP